MSPIRRRLSGAVQPDVSVKRTVTYCVVPAELASKLHEPLRSHFRDDPLVEVVVEMRSGERRSAERRNGDVAAPEADRRRIRGPAGRRVDDRRAPTAATGIPVLPRRARSYQDQLIFVQRVELTTMQAHDAENARLVTRFQAGDKKAFSELYMRNFDAVYGYARMALKEHHEAEDVTQQVFISVMGALPRYERRPGKPFRAWLFRIARNEVLSSLRRSGRLAVEEPEIVNQRREPGEDANVRAALDWITDADLLFLIERLPQPQRQAITLRYMLDLSTEEMCEVLDRSPAAVRKLEHRALRFLEERLATLRAPERSVRASRAPMLVRMRRAPVLGARRYALTARKDPGAGGPRSRH